MKHKCYLSFWKEKCEWLFVVQKKCLQFFKTEDSAQIKFILQSENEIKKTILFIIASEY